MTMKEFYIDCDGIKLHAKLDKPESAEKCPLCILIHGFTGHMEEDHIIAAQKAMNDAGVSVLRAEMFGHGKSGGQFRRGKTAGQRPHLKKTRPEQNLPDTFQYRHFSASTENGIRPAKRSIIVPLEIVEVLYLNLEFVAEIFLDAAYSERLLRRVVRVQVYVRRVKPLLGAA